MINSSHIIKSQIFEIGFYDEDAGLSFQKSIAELIRDDLTSITEKCLNEVPEDQMVIISELILELGDIPVGKVNQELPKRYEEELSRNLRLQLQRNGKKQEVVDPQKARIYLVRHFLMKGYMPWNYNSSRWTDFNDLFTEMLAHSTDEFVKAFGELMQSASARTRFIRQVEDEVIARTITHVEPTHAETINKYHHDWMDQHKKEPFTSASSQDLSKSLWEFIFNYLYEERGSYFNLKAFLVSTIHQFASHYNQTFEQVLSSLYRNYQKFQTSGLQLRLTNVLGDIFNEFDSHQSSLDFLSIERDKHEIKNITHHHLRELLEKGKSSLPALDGQSIDVALARVMNLESGVVIDFMIQLVKDQSLLAKLIEQLTEPTKQKLVYVLEPTNAPDVIHYHEKIILAEARSEKIRHSESDFSNMVWQLIVVMLINQRGSAFNHKTFLKGLIEKFSVRLKIDYVQLLDLLMEALEKLPLSERGTTPLTLIKSLLNEARKHDGVKGNRTDLSLEDIDIMKSIKEGKLTASIRELGYHHFTDLIRYLLEEDPKRTKQLISAVPSFSSHSRYLIGETDNGLLLDLGHLIGHGEMLELLKLLCVSSSKITQMDLLRGKLIDSALKDLSFSLILKSTQGNAGIDSTSLERAIIAISKSYAIDFNLLLKSLISIDLSSSSIRQFSRALDELVLKYHINVDLDLVHSQAEKSQQGNEETLIQIALKGINGIADRALIYNLGYKSVDDVVIYLLNHHAQRFKNRLTVLTQGQQSFLGIGRDISLSTFYTLLDKLDSTFGRSINQLLRLFELELNTGQPPVSRFLNLMRSRSLVHLSTRKFILDAFLDDFADILISSSPLVYVQVVPLLSRKMSILTLPTKGSVSGVVSNIEKQLTNPEGFSPVHDKTSMKRIMREEYFAQILDRESTIIPYFDESTPVVYDEIYIENAGLVIANSYLPILLERCEYLAIGGFQSPIHQQRAVLLLQHLMMDTPPLDEHHLVLNKVLCGHPVDLPITCNIDVAEEEMNLIHGLIEAMIKHWSIIGKSSVEGFRGSWLWRKGKLEHKEQAWELLVEQHSYDMLLDQLPFTLSPIKYSWMDKPLIVNWR